MALLPPRYNWGTEIKNVNATLYNQLNDSYTTTARIVNQKINKNVTTVNPPADAAQNSAYEIGDIWVNSSTNTAWIMTSRTSNTQVTWTQIT